MKNIILKTLTIAMVVAFALPSGTYAQEIEGISFREKIIVDNKTLTLRGVGLLRYWGFKAYVGAFYLEEGAKIEDALADNAKRIEIEYLRPIDGEDFGPATNKVLSRNVDSKTFQRLRPRIDYHNSLYEDVQPGDRYSLTYIPGIGTELALNDKPKGIIEGADFGSAVHSMWLGPRPMSESFKKQILGL
jgi:hypothetical protein